MQVVVSLMLHATLGPIPVEDGEAEHDPARPVGAACRSPLDCAPVEGRQATCIHRTFDGAAVGDMSWYLDSMPQNSQKFLHVVL